MCAEDKESEGEEMQTQRECVRVFVLHFKITPQPTATALFCCKALKTSLNFPLE